ncbi:sigma factor binding protein 2, chloroplastic-like [Vicia villosa]|uniref:sigma factor binding protein 2, chloroplastic-like n=1 Tax=Vicia villosa TaxID=3911 RepID=UPI00273B34D9|nr:sigma factor binding protein 2, chloroplastic-like [Vicia villosa]
MDTITTRSTNSVISSLQQKTPAKITKSKKKTNKPIKVVYISNPMKVKTSASDFMALVQELTGQYAESPLDPSKFQVYGEDGSVTDSGTGCENIIMGCDENDHTVVTVPPLVDSDEQVVKAGGGCSYEGFDEDVLLTPQMVENIWDLLPTSAFYEPFQLDTY